MDQQRTQGKPNFEPGPISGTAWCWWAPAWQDKEERDNEIDGAVAVVDTLADRGLDVLEVRGLDGGDEIGEVEAAPTDRAETAIRTPSIQQAPGILRFARLITSLCATLSATDDL